MTHRESIYYDRLNNSCLKTDLHMKRLRFAISNLETVFPFTIESYSALTEEQISFVDQMIFRFTKLQDEIGANAFRFLLEVLGEDIQNKPFRDILGILERLNIIPSVTVWMELREIRNDLAHEYPTLVNETIEKLNYLYDQLPKLYGIYENIFAYNNRFQSEITERKR